MTVEVFGGDGSESIFAVTEAAIEEFAKAGYSATKLDSIARVTGMSKRMIHYHFGDKRGLYSAALQRAMEQLQPEDIDLRLDTSVPVEGVRRLIDALFNQCTSHPAAISLLLHENSEQVLSQTDLNTRINNSTLSLYLERLLLLGQDAGAFRPGISANDVYTIIMALLTYRQGAHHILAAISGIDVLNEVNTAGMHQLIVDVVLAFLTANIPDSGRASYLEVTTTEPANDDGAANPIYDILGSTADNVFGDDL